MARSSQKSGNSRCPLVAMGYRLRDLRKSYMSGNERKSPSSSSSSAERVWFRAFIVMDPLDCDSGRSASAWFTASSADSPAWDTPSAWMPWRGWALLAIVRVGHLTMDHAFDQLHTCTVQWRGRLRGRLGNSSRNRLRALAVLCGLELHRWACGRHALRRGQPNPGQR